MHFPGNFNIVLLVNNGMNNECGVPTVITKAFESCKRKEETRATQKIVDTGKERERV